MSKLGIDDGDDTYCPIELDNIFVEAEDPDGNVTYTFNQDKHIYDLFHNLRYMQEERILTDVTLSNQWEKAFHFHSILLASVSPIFRNYFDTDNQLKLYDGKFSLGKTPTESLEAIKAYLYHPGEILEPCYEWNQFLDFATSLGMEGVVNLSVDPVQMLAGLENLHENMQMTMTNVRTDDGELVINATILAASSPLCLKTLAPEFLPPASSHLPLENLTTSAIETIFDFIYKAEITIKKDTVPDLLWAACNLRYPAVGKACCHFMNNQLTCYNAVGIHNFARHAYQMHNDQFCLELQNQAASFIIEKLHKIMVVGEFECIETADDLIQFLCKADLAPIPDSDVATAFNKWYLYDAEGRASDISVIHTCSCILKTPQNFARVIKTIREIKGTTGFHDLMQKTAVKNVTQSKDKDQKIVVQSKHNVTQSKENVTQSKENVTQSKDKEQKK